MKQLNEVNRMRQLAGIQNFNLLKESEEDQLDEMAKIKDELKSSIEAVIAANPELDGLPLKKAIRSDQKVIDALGEQDLFDNQLNKFISLTKGDREIGQRGRKASVDSVAAKDITDSEPEIKITPATSSPTSSDDDFEIDTTIVDKRPQDKEGVGSANNFKNIISKKVSKIEAMDASEQASSPDMKALKQFIKKPEVVKALGGKTIRGLVSSLIG